MSLAAGPREHRVTLQRASSTKDEYNEDVPAWAPLGTRMAAVFMGRGAERREAAMERGRQPATFQLLGCALVRSLTLKDRVGYAGSAWDIEGIAPDTPQRGLYEITAVREA